MIAEPRASAEVAFECGSWVRDEDISGGKLAWHSFHPLALRRRFVAFDFLASRTGFRGFLGSEEDPGRGAGVPVSIPWALRSSSMSGQ